MAHINLVRHQCTDLPKASTRRRNLLSQDHPVTSGIQVSNKGHPTRRYLILNKPKQVDIDVASVGIPDMWKVLSVLSRNNSINLVIYMDISQACVLRNKCLLNHEHPKHVSYNQTKFMLMKTPYVASQKILPPVMSPFAYK